MTWPADRIVRKPVARLLPYAKNARLHSPEQVAQIVRSISEFGWTVPVLVDEDETIIAGHGRILAAKELGLKTVPTVVAVGWSAAKKQAYALADNKLTLNGEWDSELLRVNLDELMAAGFDLSLTGFLPDELGKVMGTGDGLTDPDDVPEPPAIPFTQPGDVWLCGQHRVRCGDSTSAEDVAALLAGAKPNLMVTDPPYGVNYDPEWRARLGVNLNAKKLGKVANDHRADWREAWALFPGNILYVWHADTFRTTVEDSVKAVGFAIRATIIWAKDRFALSRGDYHWQHEPCLYGVREKGNGQWAGDRSQTTLWSIPARDDGGHGHSTQKPVECMRRPIVNNSNPGQAVYEPFLGSGATLIAAEMEGRVCYGQELDPVYVDVAVRRWCEFTGQTATRESDGVEFPLETETAGQ